MAKEQWNVHVGRDEATLVLYRYPLKSRLKQALFHIYDEVDHHLTGHRLCGSNLPESFWRIPVGLPRYADDRDEKGRRWLDNSLPAKLLDGYSVLMEWAYPSNGYEVSRIPITHEEAYRLYPDLRLDFEEDEDE